MKRNVFFINGLVFMVVAVSFIAIRQLMDSHIGEVRKNNPHTPDAYMRNAFFLKTNETGQREVTLFTPYATHYQVEDSSRFQYPIIHMFKNDEEWQVTSNHARGIHGTTRFYLYDNVRVKQLPSKKNAGSVLLTQSLTVFPKEDLVTTKDFVTILQPGLKINAVGLKGDLKTGNITLLSRTRGEYDPKQTK